MNHRIATLTAAVIAAAFAAAPAAAQAAPELNAPQVRAGFEVPRTASGKPDLSGIWTNASSTSLQRPAEFGEQLILTDEEMAELEATTFARNARLNAPTPKELQENWVEISRSGENIDECRSGARGAACGYNAGWTDPGDWVMRVNGQGRTSLITYPANGRIPDRLPTAERPAPRARNSDGPEARGISERCIMFGLVAGPVMTDSLYNNTYQFTQTEDHLAIWVEMIHDVRIVRFDKEHSPDEVRPYMGDSIGRWDGDTLVVETINFHPQQNVRGGSDAFTLTERFTRVDEHKMHYAFHVEDPKTWAQPWGGEYEFSTVDGEVYEYACHEGNIGLEGILAGERYAERLAAE